MKPNVIVILNEGEGPFGEKGENSKMENYFRPDKGEETKTGVVWDVYESTLLAAQGRAALTAALIHGKESLQAGVVEEMGWRRKAVTGPGLLDVYRKAGYTSLFYGNWKLGDSPPFDPRSRGFDAALVVQSGHLNHEWGSGGLASVDHQARLKSFTEWTTKGRPVFCLIDDGHASSQAATARMIKDFAVAQMKNEARPTVLIVIAVNEHRGLKEGEAGFYDVLKWSLYAAGIKNEEAKHLAWRQSVRVDKDLSTGLAGLIGGAGELKRDFYFFHQAGWKADAAPEKYRHRGSLVVGKGHALVNGLELYPLSGGLEPDLTKPLDISENQQLHSALLAAHARWWQQTREALYDPRAFSVGAENQQVTRLTAEDWRPSKIIHQDGTAPSSKPIIFQDSLVDVLNALRTDEHYRNTFPAYSGSWSVNIIRAGRYRITASLLPREVSKPEEKALAVLRGGEAFVQWGRNKVQLRLLDGATAVSVLTDADAGVTDLECWFTGQLALERELGAFFVEIERVGDKKFDLKPEAR
ncbi:MAG: hypothetical protein H7A51_03150 [Akkermansiaceae bacterium]|nr:hypothetical protein [Akkermansiaceae bacterium]